MSPTKLLLVEVYCRRHVDVVLLSYGGNGFPDFLVSQISPQRGKRVNIFSYIVTHSATKTLAFLGVLPASVVSKTKHADHNSLHNHHQHTMTDPNTSKNIDMEVCSCMMSIRCCRDPSTGIGYDIHQIHLGGSWNGALLRNVTAED